MKMDIVQRGARKKDFWDLLRLDLYFAMGKPLNYMKPSLFIIIPFIAINQHQVKPCNTNIFIPKEYQYPEDSLLMGRTFVMQKEGDSLLNYSDKKIKITSSGKV